MGAIISFSVPVLLTYVFHLLLASPVLDSYIALDNYVRNCSALKYKIPPFVVGMTTVNISFHPFQIVSVDEVDQAVFLSCMIFLTWHLPECEWNPKDFNGNQDSSDLRFTRNSLSLKTGDVSFPGAAVTFVSSDVVWTPNVATPKSKAFLTVEMPDTVAIISNQLVIASFPTIFDTICDLDLTAFPFDRQNCSIIFLEMYGMKLQPGTFPVVLDGKEIFSTSAEWTLDDAACKFHEYYKESAGSSYVECWFTMRRNSTFYLAAMIVPIILVSLMTLIVFRIPAQSGEKMSFVISIFISMSVFINLLVDILPRSMGQLPTGLACVLVVMGVTGLAAWAATVVLRRYEEEIRDTAKSGKSSQDEYSNIVSPGDCSSSKRNVIGLQRTQLAFDKGLQSEEIKREGIDLEQFTFRRYLRTEDVAPFSIDGRNGSEEANIDNSQTKFLAGGITAFLVKCATYRLSHSQLDNLFFGSFLVVTLVLYAYAFLYL